MPISIDRVRWWMSSEDPKERLYITPLLSPASQAADGAASVDLRLGHEFIIADRSAMSYLAPDELSHELVRQYWRRVRVELDRDESFTLHPRQFALAATLEYLRLPGKLTAQVIGRSSWARVGMVIAMASFVQPNYAGCLTLELQNLGDVPIQLRPGYAVAQLIVDELPEAPTVVDTGQITCAIGPQPRDLISDVEKALYHAVNSEREAATGAPKLS